MGRGGCRKCNVLGVLLRIMQSEGVKVKGLIFSEVTLILRSPFAHLSLCLRSGSKVASRGFWQCWCSNKLIVKGLCFSDKVRGLRGYFCIIRNKNEKN